MNPLCQLHFSKSHHQSKSFLMTSFSCHFRAQAWVFEQMDQISTVTQLLIPLSLFNPTEMVTLSKSWWWNNDTIGVVTWYTQQLVFFFIPNSRVTSGLENWCLFVYFYSSSSKSWDFFQIGSLHDSCFCAYVTKKNHPPSSNPNPKSIWS